MRKPFAPRALRQNSEQARLVMSLDVSDECRCQLSIACCAGQAGFPKRCPGKSRCEECPPALLSGPCEHVLAAAGACEGWLGGEAYADPELALRRFAEILITTRPLDHADQADPRPDTAISREARLSLYAYRAGRRQAIHHPDDVHDGVDEVAVRGVKGKREAGGGTRRDEAVSDTPRAAAAALEWSRLDQAAARAAANSERDRRAREGREDTHGQ